MAKVFISYSWDDDAHKKWVRDFAVRLRQNGIDVILDQWDSGFGDNLVKFMEWAVRESDYVLCICTPRYQEKSDLEIGGVGYEGYIMTAQFYYEKNKRKYIPVLRNGEWMKAAPAWLSGLVYADLRGNPYSVKTFEELLFMLKDGHSPSSPDVADTYEENSGFVNRKIELATLHPLEQLPTSYWQCTLLSAPTGYGKTWLLNRLVEKIRQNPEAFAKWNWRHVDMSKCGELSHIGYFWEQICNKPFESSLDLQSAHKQVCEYILESEVLNEAFKINFPLNCRMFNNSLLLRSKNECRFHDAII